MPAQDATVIATFSRRMRLRLTDNTEVSARIKGKKLKPVCGDHVLAEPISGESDWLITDIEKRHNELSRPNQRGQIDVLAANIELLVVVAAVTPKPDWFIVDRYLCSAELMQANAAILFNKSDLKPPAGTDAELAIYEQLGYPTLRCSAEADAQLDGLTELLNNRVSIIVGQSGVGKSSLINRLSAASGQKTAAISRKHREGRHTTVNSVMISLPGGGVVIDSPGVRDYAPALQSTEQAGVAYREISTASQNCRFANCVHLHEPGCAVKELIEEKRISPRRYESYRRTIALAKRLTQDRR